MDTNLLRDWLGLPPGPWPPPDRELLGLAPGPVVPADAERRVLQLMARLRPHQLLQPDLVTEGMNRLAQALLAVTALASIPEETASPAAFDAPPVDLRAVVFDAPVVVDAEAVVEAEVVAPGAVPKQKPRPPRPRPAPTPVLRPPQFADLPAITLPIPTIGPGQEARRSVYREMAGLRAARRALDRLKPYFGNPHEDVPTAGQVFGLVESTIALREALRHPGLQPGRLADRAPSVVGVVCEPLVLAIFRSLGDQQRGTLAQEWAFGRAWVEAAMASLRTALRNSYRPRPGRPGGLGRSLRHGPEWFLAAMTILVLALSGIRAFLW